MLLILNVIVTITSRGYEDISSLRSKEYDIPYTMLNDFQNMTWLRIDIVDVL